MAEHSFKVGQTVYCLAQKISDKIYLHSTHSQSNNSTPFNLKIEVKIAYIGKEAIFEVLLEVPKTFDGSMVHHWTERTHFPEYNIKQNVPYFWTCISAISSHIAKVPEYGPSCLECNVSNEYNVLNCIEDRFLCFGCRTTKKWKYGSILLANEVA